MLLSALLLSATGAPAQWLSQSFTLKPGWNAIYTHVDASYQTLDSLVPNANGPVAEVWLWKPRYSTMQFSEAYTNSAPGSQWVVWTSARGDTDTLVRLVGNGAYLVNNRTTNNYTWVVKGRPVPPAYQWSTTGMNLLGFPIPTTPSPNFSTYLQLALGLDLTKYLVNQAHIFRYPGGPLGPGNPIEVRPPDAHTTSVVRGQAFWVQGASNYYNRYYGPVEVSLQNPLGIHYGETLGTYGLRLKNLTAMPQTIAFNLLASESSPTGQPAINDSPQLLVRGPLNPATLAYSYTNAAGRMFTLPPQGEIGSEMEVVLGLDRSVMTLPPGSFYAGILRITDAGKLQQIDVPVTATIPNNSGLWVGQATVERVLESGKIYPKASLSAASSSAEIDRVALAAGRPPRGAELGGATWTAREADSARRYSAVASSQNGRLVAAVVTGGDFYRSSDFGTNWIASPAGPGIAGPPVAWGSNGKQQTNTPAGASTVAAIAAGGSNTVALLLDGTVIAWGGNDYGESAIPSGLTGVRAIAAGGHHVVALKNDGTVRAWGLNSSNQTTVPVGLTNVSAIAAGGEHTVALKSDGTVVAWGRTHEGQSTVPVGLSGVRTIAAGGYHTVVLKTDGTLVGWGYNAYSQATSPAGLTGVRTIAAGGYHTVALKNDGTVVAWGLNTDGQTNVPDNLIGVVAIAAGEHHSLALKNDGTVVAWGRNTSGQTSVPAGLSGATAIAAGFIHSVAVSLAGPSALASSADGRVLAAATSGGFIFISKDFGTSWTRQATIQPWSGIACSDNGQIIAAVTRGGQIYLSQDTGSTWVPRDIARNWSAIAMSSDGSKLVATVNPGTLFTSTDMGTNWTAKGPSATWSAVASSADGLSLVATVSGGQINTSTDGGANWTPRESARAWMSVASSTDGKRLTATVANGKIYTSGDAGVTWAPRETDRNWSGVAASGDATRLVAVVNGGGIYTLSRGFASYDVDPDTGLVRDQSGRYVSSGVKTNFGGVASTFPLRLILQYDAAAGQVALLQRVYVGKGAATTNTVVANHERWLDAAELASARRLSATHLPFSLTNTVWLANGDFTPGTVLRFTIPLGYNDHASNPFLHTFHPDHDNLDPTFKRVRAPGEESYDVTRTLTLTFQPAGTNFNSLTGSPQTRAGTYEETIALTGKGGVPKQFHLAGRFILQRISPVSTLTTQ